MDDGGSGTEITLMEARPSPAYRNPMIVVTLGLYWFWYRKTEYTITDKHLRIQRGILRREEDEVPLVRVAAVKTKLSPLFGSSAVQVATGAGEHTVMLVHLNRKHARQLASVMNKARAEARERAEVRGMP
jgi:membrane protein YdbS with pleckstrin-like domain